jgi:hypothetical protein
MAAILCIASVAVTPYALAYDLCILIALFPVETPIAPIVPLIFS